MKLSDKVSKLIKEGYPQKQAVAIAYSMLGKKQAGGPSEGGEPQPIQAEKGEEIFIGTSIVKSHAKKSHKRMKDDEVTDILPEGSYVASNDKNLAIHRDDAKEFVIGQGPTTYAEKADEVPGKLGKEITLADLYNKKKNLRPAELARLLRNKFSITDADDGFAELSNRENLESRAPYIEAIKQANDVARVLDSEIEDIPEMKQGGKVKKYQKGDPVTGLMSNPTFKRWFDTMAQQNPTFIKNGYLTQEGINSFNTFRNIPKPVQQVPSMNMPSSVTPFNISTGTPFIVPNSSTGTDLALLYPFKDYNLEPAWTGFTQMLPFDQWYDYTYANNSPTPEGLEAFDAYQQMTHPGGNKRIVNLPSVPSLPINPLPTNNTPSITPPSVRNVSEPYQPSMYDFLNKAIGPVVTKGMIHAAMGPYLNTTSTTPTTTDTTDAIPTETTTQTSTTPENPLAQETQTYLDNLQQWLDERKRVGSGLGTQLGSLAMGTGLGLLGQLMQNPQAPRIQERNPYLNNMTGIPRSYYDYALNQLRLNANRPQRFYGDNTQQFSRLAASMNPVFANIINAQNQFAAQMLPQNAQMLNAKRAAQSQDWRAAQLQNRAWENEERTFRNQLMANLGDFGVNFGNNLGTALEAHRQFKQQQLAQEFQNRQFLAAMALQNRAYDYMYNRLNRDA